MDDGTSINCIMHTPQHTTTHPFLDRLAMVIVAQQQQQQQLQKNAVAAMPKIKRSRTRNSLCHAPVLGVTTQQHSNIYSLKLSGQSSVVHSIDRMSISCQQLLSSAASVLCRMPCITTISSSIWVALMLQINIYSLIVFSVAGFKWPMSMAIRNGDGDTRTTTRGSSISSL